MGGGWRVAGRRSMGCKRASGRCKHGWLTEDRAIRYGSAAGVTSGEREDEHG